MSNLTEFASQQPCQVRLPGCDGGGPTTVLAHIRYAGLGGVAFKSPDLCAVHACHSCHNAIDGRSEVMYRDPASWEGIVLSALLRTLAKVQENFALRKSK